MFELGRGEYASTDLLRSHKTNICRSLMVSAMESFLMSSVSFALNASGIARDVLSRGPKLWRLEKGSSPSTSYWLVYDASILLT